MAQNYLDGKQSERSNGKNIPAESSNNGKKTDILNRSQFGILTLENLTKGLPEAMRDWLMSLPLASRSCASPLALPENGPEPMTKEICGPPLSSAFALLDRDKSCWKTSQDSLALGISEPSFETWPKAGMILDGVAYRRQKWERTIREIGSGYLPTASAWDGRRGPGKEYNPKSKRQSDRTLTTYAKKAKMWPTPNACDAKAPNFRTGHDQKKGHLRTIAGTRGGLEAGGQLNPTFVDWLIGFPTEWSALRPLGTRKFRSAWLLPMKSYLKEIVE